MLVLLRQLRDLNASGTLSGLAARGPSYAPASYNDLLQIFQTEYYIVLAQEMRNNAPRIIPFDDRPNLPARVAPVVWRLARLEISSFVGCVSAGSL